MPGQRLFPQIVRLVATIGASLVTLAAAAMVLRIREFRDGVAVVLQRVGRRPMRFRPFGLHPTVVLLASTHFLVDGFGNIFAPLLPLIIPRPQPVAGSRRHAADALPDGELSLAAWLRPCRRPVAPSAAAHRWSTLAVSVVTLVAVAQNVWTIGAALIIGGLGAAAFHPPAAALVHRYSGERRGLSMSFHITSGTLGQAMAPLVFAPVAQHFGLSMVPWLMVPGLLIVGLVLLPETAANSTGCRTPRRRRGSVRSGLMRSR